MDKMHPEVAQIVSEAIKKAKMMGSKSLTPQHIMLSILETHNMEINKIMSEIGLDLDQMYNHFYQLCMKYGNSTIISENVSPSSTTKNVFKQSYKFSAKLGSDETTIVHIVLSMLSFKNRVSDYFNKNGVTFNIMADKIIQNSDPSSNIDQNNYINDLNNINDETEEISNVEPINSNENNMNRKNEKSNNPTTKTPVLDSFCRNISKLADEDKLDPVIGRDLEIEDICRILGRRKKNNPIIIGEPGTGKSAIAEGLAIKIKEGKVPNILLGKKIFALDMSAVIAGTKYRGQFEERMQALIKEIQSNTNIILFIDELHTIVGAGNANGSLDAANIFKPALSRGELQVIGATTLKEYREHVEKDSALSRRFQKVVLEEPTEEETITMLNNIKYKYEDYHSVHYTPESIKACVTLSKRFITDRFLPDKAIDIMDEAGSLSNISIKPPKKIVDLEKDISNVRTEKINVVKKQQYEKAAALRDKETKLNQKLEDEKEKWLNEIKKNKTVITEDMISDIISKSTGIPVNKISNDENLKLMNMDSTLKKCVIGQDEAIDKIVSSIKVSRLGIKSPNRPVGTFMFLGVTGTGKTHLTKMLAKQIYGDESALIRVDMSEFSEKFSSAKLIGAPPGYVGYDEGGQLTEKVRRKPHSVILFDEIEKAHQDIYNLLLQVLDEGYVTDSLGRKIDFRNAMIILTSNTGVKTAQESGSGIGFKTDSSVLADNIRAEQIISKEVKKKFPPEFLNRLDDIIFFRQLNKGDIEKIIDIETKDLLDRFDNMGYKVKLNKSAIDFLCKEGYDPNYGARPLKRAISKYIEKPIASKIVDGVFKTGDIITATSSKGSNDIQFKSKK